MDMKSKSRLSSEVYFVADFVTVTGWVDSEGGVVTGVGGGAWGHGEQGSVKHLDWGEGAPERWY